MRYRFDDFVFDSDRFELLRGAKPVALRPLAMSLLHLLLDNRDRLVSKCELVEKIWDGRAISDSVIAVTVLTLREAIGNASVETVYGKGLRFSGVVVIEPPLLARAEDAPLQADFENRSTDRGRPSVAVLPFRQIGILGPHGALAEALPDEIITALSRLRLLRVISRGSTFQFPSGSTCPATVLEKLGAHYVLSGTLEVVGDNITVSADLTDALNKRVIWSERFAILLGGIHELRSQIVGQIAAHVEQHIPQNEAQRLRLRFPKKLSAWQAFHLGTSHLYLQGPKNNQIAQDYFRQAVKLDPGFSRAHAGLSHTHWWLTIQKMLYDVGDSPKLMLETAQSAVDSDPFDPAGHLAMGRAVSLLHDQDQAIVWLERSIEQCPSYAWGYSQLATIHGLSGAPKKAVDCGLTALSLSPLDPLRHAMFAALAVANFNQGNVEEAAEWGRKAQSVPHKDLMVMVTALCTNYVARHRDVAKAIGNRIRKTYPDMTAQGIARAHPMMSKKDAAAMISILKANGFD